MAYYLLLIFFGLLGFHLFVRLKRTGRLADKLPGPTPYPFVGNMLSFDISSQESLWEEMRHVSNTWYPLTRVWCATSALFSIRHPDDMEILLANPKSIAKGWTYDYIHPWLKTGLLTSAGEKWKQRRKILTPAFHFNIINKYMEITQEQGESLIKHLQEEGQETIKSLMPFCSKYTLNVICESAMGVALDKLENKTMEKYKQAIYKIGKLFVYRMPRPYLRDWMLNLMPFLKINRETKQTLATLHEFTDKVVRERKQYHENTEYQYLQGFTDDANESVNDIYMGRRKRLAMLDLLLSAERDGLIDEDGIKEEVDTFTFEGHDTSAMAMTFTLMLLAENKEAQDKARAEVNEVLNRSDGKLGMAQVHEFQYLERCIKESLRLYPPVPTIFRKLADDSDLQLKHALIPAGSHMVIHFFDLHRDPNFWPEPDKFDPDRFLFENTQKRHPFAYLPFSAGQRNCIGQKFAMNELKALIGRLLWNYYLEPVNRLSEIKLIADLVLRPSKPVYLKFIKIDEK